MLNKIDENTLYHKRNKLFNTKANPDHSLEALISNSKLKYFRHIIQVLKVQYKSRMLEKLKAVQKRGLHKAWWLVGSLMTQA